MSSSEGPPDSITAAPTQHGHDVGNILKNGELENPGNQIEDEAGEIRPWDQTERLAHMLETSEKPWNQTQESHNDTGNLDSEGAGQQIEDSELGKKARGLSVSTPSTELDREKIQQIPTSEVSCQAAEHPTLQALQDQPYDDPTSFTSESTASIAPVPSIQAPSLLIPQNATRQEKSPIPSSRTSTDGEFDPKEPGGTEGQADGSSKSEIQSIMDQFDEGRGGPDEEAVMSPRLELAGALLGNPIQYPPRKSSLEPLRATSPITEQGLLEKTAFSTSPSVATAQIPEASSPSSSIKSYSMRSSSLPQSARYATTDGVAPQSPMSPHNKSLPPEPDPEPDLPFDFHRFLEQLRHRTADPVAKFLRSFLIEFGKKQWMVHEQVKIISDFLVFIANKMALCDVWQGVSDAEFDNAKEGMEKLVMNRLYSQTFSPAIPPPAPVPRAQGKRKNMEKLLGPGRRGQHQEDIERDQILEQKVRIYGWVQEEHLDISPVGDSGRRYLVLAQQELLKIKNYRAPRDKVICVLNCCKVIFGLLRNSKSADTSADSFVPLLIYTVLRANPEHLVSNVQYILRFRNQDKLGGEAGYYLSSLMGAIQFVENLDRTTLTVTDEDFEKNVEAAVSAIAERHKEDMPQSPRHPHVPEKSTLSEPEVISQGSVEVEYATPRRSTSSRGAVDNSLSTDGMEENTAVGGLLRTIQRPLSSLGRIFSEEPPTLQNQGPKGPQASPPRLSPAVFQPPQGSSEARRSHERSRESEAGRRPNKRLSAEEAARQASAEAAEVQRVQRAEHNNVVETLISMFPDLDKDIIDDVVREKQGRVGLAVDACLALNS